jgi:N,N'-diacetylchitobiose transport system permease protein
VIVTYMTFVLPFSIWMLRGFILGIPRDLEEAAMVDGNTPARRVREDPAAARRAGPRRDVGLRVHPGLERVHLRLHPPHRPQKQTLTVWLSGFYGTARGTDWGG